MNIPPPYKSAIAFLCVAVIAFLIFSIFFWWTTPKGPAFPPSNTFLRAADFNRLAKLLDCPVRARSGQLVNESVSALLDCLEQQKAEKEK